MPAGGLEDVVRPSWSLSAAERVEVYHGMYLLRMVEALEVDYPAIRDFLGEEAFDGPRPRLRAVLPLPRATPSTDSATTCRSSFLEEPPGRTRRSSTTSPAPSWP